LPDFAGKTTILLYNSFDVGYNIMAKFDITEEVSEKDASI